MKILCTGGAGYVGSACLRWMVEHGHDPIAFDDLSEGNRAAVPPDRLIVGDILDHEALCDAMSSHRIEAVMHFAALASVPQSIDDPEAYWRVNVAGTKAVLDAMLECGVKLIVFSSTAATYEFTDKMPLTEESPQTPRVPYGRTKLAAEWLIRDYAKASGLGFGILRYFNASGADLDGSHGEARSSETHLIPLALDAAIGNREKVLIFGGDWPTKDGTCVRDYVHTADLAQAHQLTLEALRPGSGETFNVGCGTGTSVKEVLAACETAVGRSIPSEVVGRRAGDPAVLVASPQKLKRELGWKPQYSDVQTIVETAWRWHQAHPNGYS